MHRNSKFHTVMGRELVAEEAASWWSFRLDGFGAVQSLKD